MIGDNNAHVEYWPFIGTLYNKSVRAYEEDGKWYLEVKCSSSTISNPSKVLDIRIPKIKLPSLEDLLVYTAYYSTDETAHMILKIPSTDLPMEEVGFGSLGQYSSIFTKERYKVQKEMTLSEIEKALGHGVILKEEE